MLFEATPPFMVEAAIAQPSVQALQAMNYLEAADMEAALASVPDDYSGAEDGDWGADV